MLSIFETRVLYREIWTNADGSRFIGVKTLFEYTPGNPVVDNTVGEVPLDLSGEEILLDLPYQTWRTHDPLLLQTYNGLVNLAKLQLGMARDGRDLERVLWREPFYYDCDDHFGAEIELFNAKRLYTFNPSRERFLFDGGDATTLRTLDLVLSKDFGNSDAGYDWGGSRRSR